MIADMINNKNLDPFVAKLLYRGRKLNISIIYLCNINLFKVRKEDRLNTTHLFIMRNPNKRKLQENALNNK